MAENAATTASTQNMSPEELARELRLPEGSTVRAVDNTSTTRPYSFRIDLTAMVYRYLIRNLLLGSWTGRDAVRERRARRIRTLLFQTNVVEQLLSNRSDELNYRILGKLAETHEERQKLVARGLGGMLANFATDSSQGLDQGRLPVVALGGWMWVLNNHVYYLADSELTADMVDLATTELLDGRHRTFTNYALQVLERIALRGPAVRDLFRETTLGRIEEYCENVGRGLGGGEVLSQGFRCLLVLFAVKHMNEDPDFGGVRPFMNWLRSMLPMRGGVENIRYAVGELATAIETPSRPHLHRTFGLRPGESLHMYLGLCGSSISSDVRFMGILALTILLQVLSPGAFQVSFNTSSARAYTEQALEARLQSDSRLTGTSVDDLRQTITQRRPHALLVETILRLVNDEDIGVGQLAVVAKSCLPETVRMQAVWSPSLHRHFGPEARKTVQSMLILSRRGAITIPDDLLIRFVLPFACVAT